MRASLGAGRWRLMRQFLTENVVLSLMGGILGIGVGYGTMIWLKSLVPPNTLPQEAVVALDARVLLFTFGVSVLVGILFGLVPSLQACQVRSCGRDERGRAWIDRRQRAQDHTRRSGGGRNRHSVRAPGRFRVADPQLLPADQRRYGNEYDECSDIRSPGIR